MIVLSQDNLPKYFTLADSSNSWFAEPTNIFDFVGRDSNSLLVTIGDSWTWGADLPMKTRNQCLFGNRLANILGSDWLNLAIPAQGNHWIASMVTEVTKILPQLHYSKIYIVCTLTDPFRWVNTVFDQDFDYIAWFRDNINDASTEDDFYKLLAVRNAICIDRITTAVHDFSHVVLKVGTNFCEPTGLDALASSQRLSKPWYKLLGLDDNEVIHCVPYYSRLDDLLEFIKAKHHAIYKKWIIKLTEQGQCRCNLLRTSPLISKTLHPLQEGHSRWADYIFENLQHDL